jgi:hypothetical protein
MACEKLLVQWQWKTLKHPPYFLDMSSHDFDLFLKMKEPIYGMQLYSLAEVSSRAVITYQKEFVC